MIRGNSKIKGIKITPKMVLLSQFAGDSALFLDGSEEPFKKSMQTFEKFALFSGLKLNNDKTQVVWIGSKKNSKM